MPLKKKPKRDCDFDNGKKFWSTISPCGKKIPVRIG